MRRVAHLGVTNPSLDSALPYFRGRGLLVSTEPPLGTASFRSWVAGNGESLGRGYVSELARNFRPYDPG